MPSIDVAETEPDLVSESVCQDKQRKDLGCLFERKWQFSQKGHFMVYLFLIFIYL